MPPTPTQTILEELLNESNPNYGTKPQSVKRAVLKKPVAPAVDTTDLTFPLQLVWRNIIFFIYLHAAAAQGFYFLCSGIIMWQTIVWAVFLTFFTGMAITGGCHRLWAHKSYKAKLPLKLFLLTLQTIGFQNSVWEWCRDHRLHHKYSETNADPHNVNRGFFFAHMGWLMCRKHPSVIEKGKTIDMSDLEADPLLMFQKRHYIKLMPLFCFILPTIVPVYFWGESLSVAWLFAVTFRFCFSLHATWLVNSAAHLYGNKPYNKEINPSENRFVSLFALGEGWHNYHHTFPWDYKTSELGGYSLNATKAFIDLMHFLGQAYDLKVVDERIVVKRALKYGDGSHPGHAHGHGSAWGWGDKELKEADKEGTIVLN